jgi:hypothetical protein
MIDQGHATLLESGTCSLMVATASAHGVPHLTRAWGARVLPGGTDLRVLVPSDDSATLENLDATGAVAVTGADVPTFRSVQCKGHALAVEAATAGDRARFSRYRAELARSISEVDGHPVDLVTRLAPAEVVAVTARVEAMFDQTPGPGAGAPLPRAPS